jgi:RNA polymerase sigma-70 factor (ECF subfamily)
MRYFQYPEQAQDAMQDGFVKVFEKLETYRGEGSFEGWIRRIMVTTSLNLHRKNLKHYFHEDVDEIHERILDEAADFDALHVEEIMKLIQALPPGYQLVFNLYEIEGFSHQEIADELGVSINTSKSQLLKARRYLRNSLEQLNRIAHESE